MKLLNCWVVVFICLCFDQLCAQTYNKIRVAYFNVTSNIPIPTKFYERARANGFNYILAEFGLEENSSDWVNGRYNGNTNSRLRRQIRDEFVAADQNGLKIIPLFQTSDMHSGHWNNVNNNNVQWQTLPANVPVSNPTRIAANKRTPTFAPDPIGVFGFDSSFNQLLKVIYDAFDDARSLLSYSNLDYIHFGADEPIFAFNSGGIDKVLVTAGLCQRDRSWLANNGYGNSGSQNQIIALLGSNIKRKVQMIRAAGENRLSNRHTTVALYYADMLDPNLIGGGNNALCSFTNIFDTISSNTITIKTSSLASNQYIQDIRNQSIAVQWNYEQHYDGQDYNTDSTFRYFKANNLKFLHGNALADESSPIISERLNQCMEQIVVGADPKFNNYILGFISFHWCSASNVFDNTKSRYDQKISYMTMEFLSHILWHNAALYE